MKILIYYTKIQYYVMSYFRATIINVKMFVLSTIKHIVEISPNLLGKDFISTLIERLNKQFANYVIPNVGLCITFYDFKKTGDSFILPGNASTHTPVIFRYIVFQPLVNEVLEGVISQSSSEGITVTMHFFSDITIAPDKLPNVSKFDEGVQIWYWEYQNDGKMTQFYMDPGRRVRFKVTNVRYNNVEPGTSPDASKAMTIEASMVDMGLGCIDWWEQPDSGEIKQELADNDSNAH